jgi:hypothetical protein
MQFSQHITLLVDSKMSVYEPQMQACPQTHSQGENPIPTQTAEPYGMGMEKKNAGIVNTVQVKMGGCA